MKLRSRGMGAIDIVYFAVLVIVGISVYNSVATSAVDGLIGPRTTMNTTPQYAAAANVTSNTWSSMQTIATGPTILAAVVVLGIVGLLMSRK